MRPNILLIVLDTARADGFSPYAAGRDTPMVGELASQGVVHGRAIAPSSWTLPSHAAMFLGAPPRSVGLSNSPEGGGAQCKAIIAEQRDQFLPEVMRRGGYQTAGVSTNLWISERNGFSLGFETFRDASGERVRAMAQPGLRARVRWYLHALQAKADDGAAAVEGILREWMSDSPRAPFFWFVNLIECHSPYLPPKPWNDLGPLDRIGAATDARRYQTLEGVLRVRATDECAPDRSLRRMRHLYDRSIELMDRWLARVVELLERHKLLDDTLIIVTSDHGENFGEGSLIGHAPSLDDRLIWVPLVLRGPGAEPAPEGVTSLCHLPQMIGAAAGVEHPWPAVDDTGIAIAQYDGPVRPGGPGMAYLKRWPSTPEGIRHLTERFTCATNGRLKLVSSPSRDLVYDLSADPLELDPKPADTHSDAEIGALTSAIEAARATEWDPVPDPAAAPEEADPDLEERMKLLGYL